MSLIFFLLFLLSVTASALFGYTKDEPTLLKIKQQLGNPDILRRWGDQGYNICGDISGINQFVTPNCDQTTDRRVTSLLMQNFNVVAPFPDAICDLTELNFFVLYNCPGIYGPIPSCITKLSKLEFFAVVNTSISGSVPDFHNNTKLTDIRLANNHLSGTIPSSLSTLPNLQRLVLSSNHLTGTVPSGIIHVPYSALDLSNNNLTGEIPKCYGWVDFDEFDVSNNRLSGDASFLFGKQKNLWRAILANNSFKFDLSYIEFPYNLYELDLSHNKIYGKVPDSLATSRLWQSQPDLSFNRLCGELPQGGNMWRYNAADFANNECLCGSPLPPCFNSAPAPAPAPTYTPPF